MTRIALIAAISLGFAAPAVADTAFAIQHFNQDFDSRDNVRSIPSNDSNAIVSTSGRSNLGAAFSNFNSDKDSLNDRRGLRGAVTVVNNTTSSEAQSIFDRIRLANLEDE